ncbi:MAG: hypothetical protein AAF702_32340 [Chloroflexota bacterium]
MQIEAVAVDPSDDIYIGDGAGRIRRIDAQTGLISTAVGVGLPGYSGNGGLATQAKIGTPTAIDFDSAGNLYFADKIYHVVCRVSMEGIITTIAGHGEAGFSLDGTSATRARINLPYGLCGERFINKGWCAWEKRTLFFCQESNEKAKRV